jgi:hypothetical protein
MTMSHRCLIVPVDPMDPPSTEKRWFASHGLHLAHLIFDMVTAAPSTRITDSWLSLRSMSATPGEGRFIMIDDVRRTCL